MGKFIFVIGGARSGKSYYAQELAKGIGKNVAFIATCVPQDEEMKKRVAVHKKLRPRSWKTIEEPKNIKSALDSLNNKFGAIIIDCLGLFVSNLLGDETKDTKIKKEVKAIAGALSKSKATAILVSNDVGSGIVPANALARRFRDILGSANQMMASAADEVIFMQSGIPVKIKSKTKK